MPRFLIGLLSGVLVTALAAFAIWPERATELHDDRSFSLRAAPAAETGPSTRGAPREPARASSPPPPVTVPASPPPDGVRSRPAAGEQTRAPLQPELHIPGGKLDAARIAESEPLDKLLDAFRVR